MQRRRLFALTAAAGASLLLSACGKGAASASASAEASSSAAAASGSPVTLKVGATPVPHGDLLKVAAKNLEK